MGQYEQASKQHCIISEDALESLGFRRPTNKTWNTKTECKYNLPDYSVHIIDCFLASD